MLIVANWKTYVVEPAKAKQLFALAKRLAVSRKVSIVLAPPPPLFGTLSIGNTSAVAFAAQDVSKKTGGAETGESTAQTYAASGATYALAGHSERRAQGDTNEEVAEKLSHILAHGMIPILCVGERERDDEGRYLSFIREEITVALAPLLPKERAKVIVAYEPIWAIGKTAAEAIGPTDLAEMVLYIRKVLAELLPGKTAAKTSVLYGGSVEPENVRDLVAASGVNGVLVGHASVDSRQFATLVRELS